MYFILFTGQYRFNWACSVAGASFFGLASLAVLTVQTARRRGAEQKATLDTLIAGSIFGYSALFISSILTLTTRLHPRTYDLYLYAADAGFGLPLCVWVAQFVGRRPLLLWWTSLVYESLPLIVSLLYAYQRSGRRRLPVRVLPAFLGGGAAAYALYNLLPAAGPRYAFGPAFPDQLPSITQAGLHLVRTGDAARNAVPSMHLACALLILWTCKPLGRLARAGAALFLAFTILATLGFGEHYVVDLVVGVPYALALAAICAPRDAQRHWKTIALGASLTGAWMIALRFSPILFQSVAFTWIASLGTVLLSLFAWKKAAKHFHRKLIYFHKCYPIEEWQLKKQQRRRRQQRRRPLRSPRQKRPQQKRRSSRLCFLPAGVLAARAQHPDHSCFSPAVIFRAAPPDSRTPSQSCS